MMTWKLKMTRTVSANRRKFYLGQKKKGFNFISVHYVCSSLVKVSYIVKVKEQKGDELQRKDFQKKVKIKDLTMKCLKNLHKSSFNSKKLVELGSHV